ncbi:thiamine diphosphate-binding protein [Gongronella butleri]|nr:thiamine diphosphate-binding protein [Gongronella butleri]
MLRFGSLPRRFVSLRTPLAASRLLHTQGVLRSQQQVAEHAHHYNQTPAAATHLSNTTYSDKIRFVSNMGSLETYRVMAPDGTIVNGQQDQPTDLPKEEVLKIYKHMVQLSVMDTVMYQLQRQGVFSFYMTHSGEEALIGVAAGLKDKDIVHGQYREAYMLLYRGFSVRNMIDQCFSNINDLGKARSMPIHYGSAELNFQTISSPLATQIPQAAGSAYALKMEGTGDRCSVCFFGEGAASEGDFHAGLNMAATLNCPVIFVCRNNGYAISTPASEQYRGDGIASRGIGYGMDTIRVDGNDVWAVYNATKAARQIAVKENKPVLIEAMTYRVGHHSTSDDSTKYRDRKEVEERAQFDNPITRLRRYIEKQNWWDKDQEEAFRTETKAQIIEDVRQAESLQKPSLKHMFTDVYDELPPSLQQQEKELMRLIKEYPEYYQLDEFEKQ